MKNVVFMDPVHDPRWVRFVNDHPFGWITHLPGWKNVLEESFSHMTGFYLALEDGTGGEIKAGVPIYKVNSWFNGNRLISIPSTGHSDPLVSGPEDMDLLCTAAINLANELRSSYVEIRSYASNILVSDERFSQHNTQVSHFLPLDSSPEQLLKKFHPSSVRKRIEQAGSTGMCLKIGESEADFQVYYRLYLMLRRRLGLPPQPSRFFEMIWNTFHPAKQAMLLQAELEGKTIASLMLLKFKNRVSALQLAADVSYRKLHPDHFLYWEAIKLAYNEGYGVFDFGRTARSNSSLMDFKSRWGTEVIDLPKYFYPKKVSSTTANLQGSSIYSVARKMLKNAPLPVLRLVGGLFYRHSG